jgi:excisionase family DNA binding protein
MIVLTDKKPDAAQPQNGQADPAHGMTVGEVARYLRLGEDRIRAMIRSGELGALDTSYARAAKRRYVILPSHLKAWQERHEVSPEPKQAPRRRQPVARAGKKDRFPDD